MPRTKGVKKIMKDSKIDMTADTTNPKSIKGYLKQIDNCAYETTHSVKGKLDERIEAVRVLIGSIRLKIGSNTLNMTIGEYCSKDRNKSQPSVDSVRKVETFNSAKSNKMNINSANKMKTPRDQGIPPIPMVTPKFNPNQAISVLRRPNQGECAMSLSGSPLLVSNVCNDKVASVSVPMKDGRVISILPMEGIEATDIDLDEHTRRQLEMLSNNLKKCIDYTSQHRKKFYF